ncbi:MFS transporter [Liquorilactobacillus mali]|uniref:MFS transporter n=1 Tax=Liquorilactobacillus mali TaxID=1618 RepID=UPI00235049C2|nr:MFS transporter [Liquorilactobacillus mali]MDC7952197.1 MFS transporter [Liquorilactobacillus mali]MDV7756874.1 MFS transporter [Liquorilactobacillus mali]
MKNVTRKINLSLGAVGILTFVGILVETSMNVTFPTLMKTFNESLSMIQWLTTGYLLMVTLVMGATSYLLKRFKRRQLFIISAGLAVVGEILCFSAPNFSILMVGRLLQASGTGISTPLMFSLIFSEVPMAFWGAYTGIAAMLISLAPALGPTFGGIMNHYLSWRAIFSTSLLLVLIALIIGLVTLENRQLHSKVRFDYNGFLSLSLFLILLEFGVQQLSEHLGIAILLLLLCLISMYFFIRHEQRSENALFNPALFKNKYLMFRLTNYFILQMINISLSFVIPIFAENVLLVNSLIAGLILLPGSLLGSLSAPFAGKWYDRVGARRPLLLSNFLVVGGMLLFAGFISKFSVIIIGLVFVITRLGFNTGFGNTMSDASKATPHSLKADQNSLFSMSQQYAGSIGTAIMSTIISLQEKSSGSVHTGIASGSQLGFILLMIFGIIALVCTITLNKEGLEHGIEK